MAPSVHRQLRSARPAPITVLAACRQIPDSLTVTKLIRTTIARYDPPTDWNLQRVEPPDTDDRLREQMKAVHHTQLRLARCLQKPRLALPSIPVPGWDLNRAFRVLGLSLVPIKPMQIGRVEGTARGRTIAISPLAADPVLTLFHEMAHVLLGHTVPGPEAGGDLDPDRRYALHECQAEGAAWMCAQVLGVPSVYSYNYIHDAGCLYKRDAAFVSAVAQGAKRAASLILEAGRVEEF